MRISGRAESEAINARRRLLVSHLRSAKAEIEQMVLSRAEAVAPIPEFIDPQYTRGLRQAVDAAVEYVLGAIEFVDQRSPPIPPDLLVQARVAARHNVPLSAVLQRYIAGYSAISDFVLDAVETHRAAPVAVASEVAQLIRVLLDETTVAVSREHAAEEERRSRSTDHLDTDRVVRLLRGELRFAADFAYDFHGRHLGAIATGPQAADAIGVVGEAAKSQSLVVRPGELSAWAWFRVGEDVDWPALEHATAGELPNSVAVAVGEPHGGVIGWRRTHLEARAALELAVHRPGQLARYGRNELQVAVMNNELLRDSLRDSYLVPLSSGNRGATALKQTVRAYLETGHNASSAAATLGVSRQTVNARVRTAEELLGRPLMKCASAVEVALWLDSITEGGSAD